MYNLLILISGDGTNLQYLIDNMRSKYKIIGVISNKKNAYGLVRADKHNIPTYYFPYIRNKISRVEYDLKLVTFIKHHINYDLIILAGWMHIFTNIFINQLPNIINLHPALPNMFPGANAIQDSFNAFTNGRIKYTGCMVHRVTGILDVGEVISTIKIPIYKTDTLNDLKRRMKDYEKQVLMESINKLNSSRCKLLKNGKVRDVYTINDEYLIISHSDRLSSFDRHICNIDGKGQLLMNTSIWWFKQTENIIKNHYINHYKNYMLVKKCGIIPIEFVVRGYITGSTSTSLWTHYERGERFYCGEHFPDGLKKNQKLEIPVITPTTKSDIHDELISGIEIVDRAILTRDDYDYISKIALELFKFGQEEADKKGLILVDTKYEFGYDREGNILLIDEIHTCDSSRYWRKDSYNERFTQDKEPIKLDKDTVRDYVKQRCDPYNDPIPEIPLENRMSVYKCYNAVYEILTGNIIESIEKEIICHDFDLLIDTLLKEIKVVIICGSIADNEHLYNLQNKLDIVNLTYDTHICSAHKNTKRLLEILNIYNEQTESKIIFITVAGRSNALSGVVACNTGYPVIACPPFQDKLDMMVNIHSTLQCPSNTPVLTILDPINVALAIKRIFMLKL